MEIKTGLLSKHELDVLEHYSLIQKNGRGAILCRGHRYWALLVFIGGIAMSFILLHFGFDKRILSQISTLVLMIMLFALARYCVCLKHDIKVLVDVINRING